MGNSQSLDINEGYINEQRKIIAAQQEQINRLSKISQQSKPERVIPEKKESKFETILKIFELDKNYDETSLKKSYLKLAMIHHPDKGGDTQSFKKLQMAYKLLLKKLSEKDNDKDHHQFKSESKGYLSEQQSNNLVNINLSEKFDNDQFNKLYEENRMEDVYDNGYSGWIEKNKVDEDTSHKKLFNGGFDGEKFNTIFNENMKKKSSRSIVKYEEPKVDISFRGKDSIVTLGQDKINDFSGECSSGLSFRDYKDAYTNTCLIDIHSVDISKRSKNMKEQSLQRKNINYSMSEQDLKKEKIKKLYEEKKEKERVQRLQQTDQKHFDAYTAIHQRMLGK